MVFTNRIFLLSVALVLAFCSLGFAQDDCSTNPNPCTPGNCTNIPGGGFYCTCGTGYTSTGTSCYPDPCDPSPCSAAQSCLILSGYSAACVCPTGFKGTNCTQIEYCYPNPCVNGACTDLDNGSGYNCTCNPGFLGTNCSQVDPCYNNPCQNGATCNGTVTATCTCPESYYGTYCNMFDPCFINPCQNGGNCTDQLQTAVCTCAAGYTGSICDAFDYCASNPCSSAATCSNQGTTFICSCPPGWQGYNCTEVEYCNPNPCQNGGTCNATNGNCTCPTGWYGTQCQLVDLCASAPCQNGGNCSRDNNPLCSCPTGTSGTYCQILDPCYPDPCQNNGNCTNQFGTASCSCAAGYIGTLCDQIDYCLSSPCVSNSTCFNNPTSYSCACSPGWKGPTCSEPDACAPGPCQNGATCIDLGGGVANCSCSAAYTGLYCSYANPCYSAPCANGGTCTITSSYTPNCTCAAGFTGATCSTVDPCDPNPCQYGGICYQSTPGIPSCNCSYNTTGSTCQYIVQIGSVSISTLPVIYAAFSQNELSINFSINICDQTGITCDPDNGQIIEIDLSYSNLTGTIPNSLGSATYLQKLYLNGNNLTGTIPGSLSQLSSLQILDLSSNNLTGTIPASFSQLSSLSVLKLNKNVLTGTVPSFLAALLLVELDLASNLFCPQVNYSQFASKTDYTAPTSACAVCTSQTCLNGGTCTVSSGAFHCTCLPGFVGTHCDQTVCDLQPCQNGGVCSQTGSQYSCSCVGTYFTGTNCTDFCGEDTYKDLTTSNTCVPCPSNSSSFGQTGLGSSAGCLCVPNFYLNASQICEACPDNSKSAPGSTSISSCFCDNGLGGPTGVCEPCPVDTYRDLTTPGTCSPCPSPSTTFNVTGLSSISSCGCPANYYGFSGQCTACPSGTTSVSNSASVTNCNCDSGYGGPLGGPCTPCPSNTYSVSPNLCVSCPLGSFTGGATGQSNVSNCECGNGYYGVNNTNCTACPSGSTSPYNSPEESSCYCIQGYVGANGAPPCTICPIDTYYYNSTNCFACPANSGTQNLTGTVSPNSCYCYPGFYGTPGNCTACPAYATSAYGSLTSSACQCFSGFLNVSGECTCPAGSYPNGNVCSPCPANSYGNGTGPCVSCPAGSGLSPYVTTASDISYCQCLNGYYGPSASSCQACPAYSTTSSMGSTSFSNCTCLPTFAGTPGSCYCPTGTGIYYNACLTCPADTYISGGNCVSCPGNSSTFGLSGQTNISACACIAGFYGTSLTSCSPCPALSNSTQNTTTIHGCECVSEATEVSGACVCSPGYVPVNNNCEACAANTYSVSNGTCVSCPSLSSTNGLTAQSSIAACQCVYNTYGSSGNCTICPCSHGACVPQGNSFTCDCTYTGYYGNLCQIPDGCSSSPCQNGGFCNASNSHYTCNCANTGYVGSNCQSRGECSVVNEGNAAWPSAQTFEISPGTCNPGFYGSPTRYCLANETFGPISNPCIPLAGNCSAQLNYAHANWPSTRAGKTAIGTCVSAWQGSPTRICQDDGTWQTLVNNQCQRIVCAATTIASATFSQTYAGYSATGTCAQGMSGSPVRLCQNNGTWGPSTGTACFTPGSCAAQLYVRANWPETPPGTTATGVCVAGWTGSPTRICKASGVWETLVTNQCQHVVCAATTIQNATFSQTYAGYSVIGTCATGTYGHPERVCQNDGTWGSDIGVGCAAKCPAETLYMKASWPATIPGTYAKGSCATGFHGNPSRLCNTSGNWSSSVTSGCVS